MFTAFNKFEYKNEYGVLEEISLIVEMDDEYDEKYAVCK
jgi:hypothetical protein